MTDLANAGEEEVLTSWAGLGYYSRARNLHKSAKIILSEYQGVFPTSYSELIALPGMASLLQAPSCRWHVTNLDQFLMAMLNAS